MISIASQDNGYPRLEGKIGKISRELQMCPFFFEMIVSEVHSVCKNSLNPTLIICVHFCRYVYCLYRESEGGRGREEGRERDREQIEGAFLGFACN